MYYINIIWRRVNRTPCSIARLIIVTTAVLTGVLFSEFAVGLGLGLLASLPPAGSFLIGLSSLDKLEKMRNARYDTGGKVIVHHSLSDTSNPMERYSYGVWVWLWCWQTFLFSSLGGLAAMNLVVWLS